MHWLRTYSQALTQLFYPHQCAGCGSDTLEQEQILCSTCTVALPETGFADLPGNPVEKIFYGRISLMAAHSQYYFAAGSLIQRLVHQLKYQNGIAQGMLLGKLTAYSMQDSGRFTSLDAIIPLPLYPDKEKLRGYNQAMVIAEGMAEVLHIPVLDGVLIRQRYTETQTKKQRTSRWENVRNSFAVADPSQVKNRHCLLVDDVVTTGATLEAAGAILLQEENVQLSLATLMYAVKQ